MKTSASYCNLKFCRAAVLMFVLLCSLFNAPQSVRAAISAGYSEYYIPGSTDQLFQILKDIDNSPDLGNALGGGGVCTAAPCNRMHNVITISVSADNVTVYYDHWENGYGVGSVGNDETYVANKGDVLTFESGNILVPRAVGATCSSMNPNGASTACYDGRDHLYVAGGAVSVAEAFWPEVTQTIYANAWEVYPIKPYQTDYTVPVGEDLSGAPNNYTDFEQVFVIVQATQDGTTVEIDDPATPLFIDRIVTLNRGEVTELPHISAGTTVNATAPVQVQFIVGQFFTGQDSDSRSYTAVPSGLWEASYYSPVSGFTGGVDTDVFIYNPTASALTINYQDSTGNGSFSLPANSTRSFQALSGHFVPAGSALYLAANDGVTKFWAIGSVDTESPNYNYGFALIPPTLLTDEYFVSWAPGTRDFSANGSPVFVTPTVDNTTVFVDYYPADGVADETIIANRLDVLKLRDPTNGDNTGMHIWATSPIAVAWGEDSDTPAPIGNPYIDAGYAILPLNQTWLDTVLTLNKSTNPSSVGAGAGQTSVFTLVIKSDAFGIDAVSVVDNLPPFWAYVPGSTTITLPNLTTISGASADPTVSGLDLTWDKFPVNPLNMGPNETLTIAYTAVTTGTPPLGISTNQATATGKKGNETFSAFDSATITHVPGNLTKTVTPPQATIGQIVTYTVNVIIPPGTYSASKLEDTLDSGLAFVACDSVSSGSLTTDIVDPSGTLTPFEWICANPTVDSNGSPDPADVDRHFAFNFGTLTNGGNQDVVVTVVYRAIVLDIASNVDGVKRDNSAVWSWANGSTAPVRTTVAILEPKLTIDKTVDNTFIANGTEVTFTLTIAHDANASHVDAFDVTLIDPLPTGLAYVSNTLDCTLGAQDPDAGTCIVDLTDPTKPTIRAMWSLFSLNGGDSVIQFRVAGNDALPASGSITNTVHVDWSSMEGDQKTPRSFSDPPNQFAYERYYDPGDPVNVYGANDALVLTLLGTPSDGGPGEPNDRGENNSAGGNRPIVGGVLIPVSGFAPGVVTELKSPQPAYNSTGLRINIPALNLIVPVVGVQLKNGTWDVSWLWGQAGWLQKTSYPTFPGNSVVTGHDVNADGTPGPFSRIKQLQVGDYIFVELNGYRYTYKVVSNSRVSPNDISILRHEEKPWLTLVTCDKYDEKTGTYLKRVVVRTVLIDVDIK
jgi:LPXTG-site transpeptidase (sortase) family protein